MVVAEVLIAVLSVIPSEGIEYQQFLFLELHTRDHAALCGAGSDRTVGTAASEKQEGYPLGVIWHPSF